MKNRRSLHVALIAALAILGIVGAAHADDAFKSLAQGVDYRHDVRAAGPLSIHVRRIDRRQKWDLETGLGQGSMIGWNDNYLYFIVVDGRQKFSIGLTYPEMAALVKEYGCVEAVELDGGGSSTIWAMGKILNSPSDGRPRAIANGLILFRDERAKP